MRVLQSIGLMVILAAVLQAQPTDWRFAVTAHGGITTGARLMTNPDAPNPEDRTASESFNGMWSVGGSARMPIIDGEFFVSISAEYASSVKTQQRPYGTPTGAGLVMVDEGIQFLPVEAGLHAIIPLGSQRLQASICGGVGLYFASRILRIEEVSSQIGAVKSDINIFVGVTMGYRLLPGLMIESDLLFRDPEIQTENRFDAGTIFVRGVSVPLPTAMLPSSIIVDGMRFSLGFVWEL
jgi:hypothetical protein